MHVLRAEKGYIIVGQETDGTVIPSDLGLDWAVGKAKPDFVGKRSLARPDMLDPDREQLVGLFTEAPRSVLEEGAQIVADAAAPAILPSALSVGPLASYYLAGPAVPRPSMTARHCGSVPTNGCCSHPRAKPSACRAA